MKHILAILLLCASCAFTAKGQTLAETKVKFDAARTSGAKWSAVENHLTQQAAAAAADKAAAVRVEQAKAEAIATAHAAVVAKLLAATTPTALIAVRTEVLTPEIDKQRAALAAELAAVQAKLNALR